MTQPTIHRIEASELRPTLPTYWGMGALELGGKHASSPRTDEQRGNAYPGGTFECPDETGHFLGLSSSSDQKLNPTLEIWQT